MEEDAIGNAPKFKHNPDHEIATCADCVEEMAINVHRLGDGAGYVHKTTGNYMCSEEINPILRSCVDCIHFKRVEPYKWGECMYPLPWWIHKSSPIIHSSENNASICKCFEQKSTI
jgi:hypothetical protein